jgi:hypothetical protein
MSVEVDPVRSSELFQWTHSNMFVNAPYLDDLTHRVRSGSWWSPSLVLGTDYCVCGGSARVYCTVLSDT